MKLNIKNKLFLIITSIFLANIAAVLMFGGTFLEDYYIFSVKRDLKTDSVGIKLSYMQNDLDMLADQLQDCSNNNVTVLIYEKGSNQVLYSTARSQYENGFSENTDARKWLVQATQNDIFRKLESEDPIIAERNDGNYDFIELYSKINQNTYLFMQTPREYLASTARIAIKFFVLSCFISMSVGIIITYFLAKRIAKPIQEIDLAAQRIAEMDFSDRCEIHTGDEIEALSNSVNKMADELSKNIDLLRKDLEREEHTNRIRQEFIANASHDFKTPLSLITAYTEAWKDGSIDESELYEVLLEQSTRMNRLVTQMLTLSQLESGMLEYDMSVFSLNELLHTVIQSFRLVIKQKDIILTDNVEEEYIAFGDYHRIEQVITNLLENALKYVDDKKRIWINIFRRDGKLSVVIGNSHPPLSDEICESLFEIFYRVDASREKHIKGHGIGLAIVKNIVLAHNGSYGVRNVEDGVEFWFTLSEVSDQMYDDFD